MADHHIPEQKRHFRFVKVVTEIWKRVGNLSSQLYYIDTRKSKSTPIPILLLIQLIFPNTPPQTGTYTSYMLSLSHIKSTLILPSV